jgi:protein ImuB
MIACLTISSFALRVALRPRSDLSGLPVALAPASNTPEVIEAFTLAAEKAGLRTGMRLSEALATCPTLVLLEQDPASVADVWEAILHQLEEAGFEVEPLEHGCVLFDTAPVEPLAGGLEQALERAMAAVDSRWQPSLGVAARRFAAVAAASVTVPGRILVVDDADTALFLEPLPLHLLPLSQERREEFAALGIQRLGELACLPRASVADRFGSDADQAWLCARSEDRARVVPRQPSVDLVESIEFPDPVANSSTLEHSLARLIDLLLARPDRKGRALRKVALSARLVSGGSWRRALTLREPSADPTVLRVALTPRLSELPAPALDLKIKIDELTEWQGVQEELLSVRGKRLQEKLREGLRQVRTSVGRYAVCTVVEIAPWSRIPENRAILVPRDD